MIQIRVFDKEDDVNAWLRENDKRMKVIDVKYQKSITETHQDEQFMIVYEIA